MAWLQKRPQVADPVNFYTVGLNKTLLLVGLGNIGKEYEGTRHNIGFACIDAFVDSNGLSSWVDKKDLKCHMSEGRIGDCKVIAIKPTTLMNLSGEAVLAVSQFYKIAPQNILVAHDELDIDFGQIRTRMGGSSAGHNGVKSVTKLLGDENYGRVRVGIGPKPGSPQKGNFVRGEKEPEQMETADYVLQGFSRDQQANMSALLKESSAILSEYTYGSGQLTAETRSFLF